MNYVKYLREYIGHKPVILNGTSVIVLDGENRVLLQKRTYPQNNWGPSRGNNGYGRNYRGNRNKRSF